MRVTSNRSWIWRARFVVQRIFKRENTVLFAWKENILVYRDSVFDLSIDCRSLKDGFAISLCPEEGWHSCGLPADISDENVARIAATIARYMEGYGMALYVAVRHESNRSGEAMRLLVGMLKSGR